VAHDSGEIRRLEQAPLVRGQRTGEEQLEAVGRGRAASAQQPDGVQQRRGRTLARGHPAGVDEGALEQVELGMGAGAWRHLLGVEPVRDRVGVGAQAVAQVGGHRLTHRRHEVRPAGDAPFERLVEPRLRGRRPGVQRLEAPAVAQVSDPRRPSRQRQAGEVH
jgi:hypothetical protein